MQRNVNESFDAYKARRAVANKAVKAINYDATHGGTVGARKQLRQARASQRMRGVGITRAVSTKRSPSAIAHTLANAKFLTNSVAQSMLGAGGQSFA